MTYLKCVIQNRRRRGCEQSSTGVMRCVTMTQHQQCLFAKCRYTLISYNRKSYKTVYRSFISVLYVCYAHSAPIYVQLLCIASHFTDTFYSERHQYTLHKNILQKSISSSKHCCFLSVITSIPAKTMLVNISDRLSKICAT